MASLASSIGGSLKLNLLPSRPAAMLARLLLRGGLSHKGVPRPAAPVHPQPALAPLTIRVSAALLWLRLLGAVQRRLQLICPCRIRYRMCPLRRSLLVQQAPGEKSQCSRLFRVKPHIPPIRRACTCQPLPTFHACLLAEVHQLCVHCKLLHCKHVLTIGCGKDDCSPDMRQLLRPRAAPARRQPGARPYRAPPARAAAAPPAIPPAARPPPPPCSACAKQHHCNETGSSVPPRLQPLRRLPFPASRRRRRCLAQPARTGSS